jgi:hypothetical protein
MAGNAEIIEEINKNRSLYICGTVPIIQFVFKVTVFQYMKSSQHIRTDVEK